uniref:Acetylglutamate kinase n=1 Tax=Yamadaella caenomyce TaxID=259029 RepID=A0A1G4NYW3_9FLOR|nr:Acetylglutamate kinase [Yamadaella caenomyce]SCW23873.1 Acetylglutamate kinase [Yamadaella caenomyce]
MDFSDQLNLLRVHPYLSSYKQKKVVIKYGGAAMLDDGLMRKTVDNISLLVNSGVLCIIVHGGGPFINTWLEKMNIEPDFKNGIRVTNSQTMQIVQMVLAGQVNKNIVSLLNTTNVNAIGISGQDAQLLMASSDNPDASSNVGRIEVVNSEVLDVFLKYNYVPVVAPIGADTFGISYNINADTVAGAVASSVGADVLIMLTDTPGILTQPQDPSTVLTTVRSRTVEKLIENRIVTGGMIPKLKACLDALNHGVKTAKILDGRVPNALLKSFDNATLTGSVVSL